ncbi:ABC transporter permease subunit [Paractinoplanes globisporus]|uniref:ABC transporter permease subunit n=1 Tax=Paractinoplanes globisporus TaxID=113565 RepID=A0ABW6WGV7_9ACTN|nr:ABC transporter permease subunit [Actinoplanes globisporus]
MSALRGEWAKFRSVRTTAFCLVLAAGMMVLFSALLAFGSTIDDPCPCNVDQAEFLHRPLAGDGTIVARVASQEATGPWAKAGIMMKESAEEGSPYAALMVTPGHGVHLQANFTTDIAGSSGPAPRWLKLTRAGATITGFESSDGTTWQQVGAVSLALPRMVRTGLFANSPTTKTRTIRHAGSTTTGPEYRTSTATFDRVGFEPAQPGSWTATTIGAPRAVDDTLVQGTATEAGGVFTVTGAGDVFRLVNGGDNDMLPQMLGGVLVALIALVPLGVVFITSEYARGTIRTTFTVSPRRGRVLAAKAVVLGAAAFAAGLVATVVSFYLTYPILHGNGYKAPSYPQPSLWTPLSLRAVLGTALVMAIVAVLSLGIGTLVRRTAAAVTVVIAVVVLPRIIGAFLPVPVELWINRITPLAGLSIQQTRDRFDYAIGPWPGLAVLCAWAAAALALAWWSLRRRDA